MQRRSPMLVAGARNANERTFQIRHEAWMIEQVHYDALQYVNGPVVWASRRPLKFSR